MVFCWNIGVRNAAREVRWFFSKMAHPVAWLNHWKNGFSITSFLYPQFPKYKPNQTSLAQVQKMCVFITTFSFNHGAHQCCHQDLGWAATWRHSQAYQWDVKPSSNSFGCERWTHSLLISVNEVFYVQIYWSVICSYTTLFKNLCSQTNAFGVTLRKFQFLVTHVSSDVLG